MWENGAESEYWGVKLPRLPPAPTMWCIDFSVLFTPSAEHGAAKLTGSQGLMGHELALGFWQGVGHCGSWKAGQVGSLELLKGTKDPQG